MIYADYIVRRSSAVYWHVHTHTHMGYIYSQHLIHMYNHVIEFTNTYTTDISTVQTLREHCTHTRRGHKVATRSIAC